MRIFLAIIEKQSLHDCNSAYGILSHVFKDPTRYDWIIVETVWETHTS